MKIGQRWYSEAEPELGLGVIEEIGERNIQIKYTYVDQIRMYNIKSAPIKRLIIERNEIVKNMQGDEFIVIEVHNQDDYYIFETKCGNKISEQELHPNINFTRADQRVLGGSFDSVSKYLFRYENLLKLRALDLCATKGYEGSRVKILPHQASLFSNITKMIKPKVILCDEVGLGKTIQAGIILKNHIERGLVKNCLIIVPDALQYQWFFELYKKFNLLFKTVGQDSEDEGFIEIEGKDDNIDYVISSFSHILEAKNLDGPWDAVIIDESHRIKKDTPLWDYVSDKSKTSSLSLFLTATPEALGLENFFDQLNLLDSTKYQNFEDYKKEQEYFAALPFSDENLKEYSSGRNYFRNTRKNLSSYENLFPTKTLELYEIAIKGKITDKAVIEEKASILIDLLTKNPSKKFLLIAKSKTLILGLKKIIDERVNIKIALFYKDQSLLEKDRQAAFFQESDGAQLLLSTEIGSEGRNFEFASELFLFDIPMQPTGVIQRIGRLDRIGQYNPIKIHLPIILNSIEESLYKLYNSFNIFTDFPKGISEFYENERTLIEEYLKDGQETSLNKIIAKYQEFTQIMGKNSDPFLDAHSYNHDEAKLIRSEINQFARDNDIQDYLEQSFDLIGVDHEKLNSEAYFARPSDNMLIPALEGLSYEGQSYTTERSVASHRDDLLFMNWESALPKALLSLFTSSEIGNSSLCKSQGALPKGLYFECIYVLRGNCSNGLDTKSYLPLTPMRVLIGIDGKDYTVQYSKKLIDSSLAQVSKEEEVFISQNLKKDTLSPLLGKAKSIALGKSQKYITEAKEKAQSYFGQRREHLSKFSKNNIKAKVEEIKLGGFSQKVIDALDENEFYLDSLRVIIT